MPFLLLLQPKKNYVNTVTAVDTKIMYVLQQQCDSLAV